MNPRTLKKHREPVKDCPQPDGREPDGREPDWRDGSRECFCDMFSNITGWPRHTCGECPRDRVRGAWDARQKFLDRDF